MVWVPMFVDSVAIRWGIIGWQGCISCGILLSGTGARGVSSEHMENVEMFSVKEKSKLTFVDV